MLIRCEMCGKLFDDGNPEKLHGRHKLYCAECRLERDRESSRRREKEKNRQRRVQREAAQRAASGQTEAEKPLTIRQVNELAAACGMHYGQYVALHGL